MGMAAENAKAKEKEKERRVKTPLKSRTQSPAQVVLLLSPNDDNLERAQSRAARAASVRRMSNLGGPDASIPSNSSEPGLNADILNKEQILDLLQNCIKLASENKINQRNTWDLGLIDHLSEIIHVDDDSDTETNFQKASCTLEAGVKIYSLRVDSVHSEAYKVLGGINRTGKVEDTEEDKDGGDVADQDGDDKKRSQMMLNPSITLETSLESLNLKKFDVAFSVDPLYHQTSAQFDEGGAKGLLFNTLNVNNDCLLVFDSSDTPGKFKKNGIHQDQEMLEMHSVSFIKDCVKQMAIDMQNSSEISPTLMEILRLLDDPFRDAAKSIPSLESESDVSCVSHSFDEDTVEMGMNDSCHTADTSIDNFESPELDCSFADGAPCVDACDEDGFGFAQLDNDYGNDMPEDNTVDYLILGMGLSMKSKSWAGPDHWKYRRSKDEQTELSTNENKLKRKKREPFAIDFLEPREPENLVGFAPPKSQKSLLRPQTSNSYATVLPEDCHYQADELVKFFMLPSVLCISNEAKKATATGEAMNYKNDYAPSCAWGDNETFEANWDDEQEIVEDSHVDMVVQPRKVQKIEVNYDRASKQVDVHILKKTLWSNLQDECCSLNSKDKEECGDGLSFQNLLHNIPADCPAAALEDISVHLCFICLLHLANEHSLTIKGCAGLDDLSIRIPETVVE